MLALGVAALEAPKREVDGVALVWAEGLKLNRLLAGAVAVVLIAPCALVPMLPNMLVGGVCNEPSFFCAAEPNPLNRLFCGAAAVCVDVPSPPNMLLVAGVLVLGAGAVMPPKVKGCDAEVVVLVTFGVELVVPNMLLEGAPLVAPNMLVEGAPVVAPNMPPEAPLVVPNIFVDGAPLVAPNMLVDGALLVVLNMPPGAAELVVLCPRPPNGLLCGCALNIDEPPNVGAGVLPFTSGAGLADANGLLPPAVKLKPAAGG